MLNSPQQFLVLYEVRYITTTTNCCITTTTNCCTYTKRYVLEALQPAQMHAIVDQGEKIQHKRKLTTTTASHTRSRTSSHTCSCCCRLSRNPRRRSTPEGPNILLSSYLSYCWTASCDWAKGTCSDQTSSARHAQRTDQQWGYHKIAA